VYTKPGDLPDSVIAKALEERWGIRVASLDYQAVGFGSHHWLVTPLAGQRLFATVDDLAAKLATARDTTSAAFGRLTAAFGTALALRMQGHLEFVIAPMPAAGGKVVARLSDRYSLAVHPYLAGKEAGPDGQFARAEDRQAVIDMLVRVHAARVGQPRTDDFAVPKLDTLRVMMAARHETWTAGPYAQPAQDLLRAHARDLRALVSAYQDLARRVAARPDRMVITHGEPHAGNVIVTDDGLALVDWDTVLLAPPERDLWDLAADEPSLLDRYVAATGTEIDEDALVLYGLWYDLAEIGGYLSLFRSAHDDSADASESWKNLRHFLRPAERWPRLTALASDLGNHG
jgi:spectinomycin phosphotransferase/16S rRNA (guanine(1405)-N(7))-methyltransferase